MLKLFHSVYQHRAMILALAGRELESRYVGTLGGILWTFAHPLAIVTIFYFVFAVGFKSQGPGETSFVLWFVCGFVPWSFFNETLLAATDSITRHAHLIKKTVFPSEILPIVQIVAGLVPHFVFLVFVGGLLVWFQIQLAASRLMVVYFLFCTCILLVGLSWLFSAIQVFYRDVSHALSIALNLCFWVTPIVWSPEKIPEGYRGLVFFNPMSYIVEGYRGLLILNELVWPSLGQTVYFWCVVTATFLAGAYMFGRLKPEFADVM
jgi:lipopolysaccharide transport system permease protein/teichoic acid transport system permease protein